MEETPSLRDKDYRTLLENIPVLIVRYDTELRRIYVNPAWEKVMGLSSADVINKPADEIPELPVTAKYVEKLRQVLETGTPEKIEINRASACGKTIFLEFVIVPEYDRHGKMISLLAVGVDQTERREAEEQLRNSERNLRTTIDTIPAFIFSALPDGSFDFASQNWFDYSGLSPEEVYGWDWTDVVHPEDRDRAVEKWRESMATGVPVENEHRVRQANGEYRWFLARNAALRDENGHIVRRYVVLVDIENQKRAEEQIRNSERNLHTALETIPAYVWSALPDGSINFASQSIFNYLGIPAEAALGWDWVTLVHPEDRDRAVEIWRESLATGEPRENELRFRLASGEYRWFLSRSSALRDDKGDIVRWYGALMDIENLKRAEEQLRNNEKNLTTIIETIPAFVRTANPDGSIDFVSQSWLDYVGLSREEWVGWGWMDKVHPEDHDRVVESRRQMMATGEPRERELRIRQANGEYRWFLSRHEPLRDEKGKIIKWYSVMVDIEDKKRAEVRLRQALDEIKKLQNQLSKENIVLREEVDRTSMFEEIVGASPALKAVLARIDKVAPTDSIVFITGETGTGKELVARAIHKRSPRASRAFVSVNCAAIPAPLIASELFGHEKGAFTGAHQRRLGRFELAEGGTIFLDEIGELPMETQIALLRVLQDQEFERLGGNQRIRANARVITATNRDLQAAIEAGSFRSDLFYRLNVFPIQIPPLRERKEDIPILVEYFIQRYASKLGKKIRSASRKAMDLLQSYSWPGNIRELQNVIERSIIVCDTEIFSVDENWLVRASCQPQPTSQPLSDMLVTQIKDMIEAALAESGGRVSGPSGAAAKLGMPASTLESKIKSLKINKYLFKKST